MPPTTSRPSCRATTSRYRTRRCTSCTTSTSARATLDVPPAVALPRLTAAGRSPLTVEEGLSVVLQRPEVLREVCCFSLLGSRCGDRRVPALWVKRGGQPRLGWCWEGAPHTWLGSASCAARAA